MKFFAGIFLCTFLVFGAFLFFHDLQSHPSGDSALAGSRTHVTPKSETDVAPESVIRLEKRVRANPKDGAGWDAIAPVYLKLQRFGDAGGAYRQAIQILGETASRLMGVAIAEVFANSGNLNQTSRKAFEKALTIDPSLHVARYWLAIAKEQDGRFDVAAQAWQDLLAKSSANANWRPQAEYCLEAVRARLQKAKIAGAKQPEASLCSKGGTRLAGKPQGSGPYPNKAHARKAQAGESFSGEPTAKQFSAAHKAAQKMAPGDRMAMVNQMVAGLAKRLKNNGDDLEGWVKLVRSYSVLGKRDAALEALTAAEMKFKGNSDALGTLSTLKQKLKLGS